MADGALGDGGAFVSALFGRPPGQRTAGQTLKPSSSAASGNSGACDGPHVMTAGGSIGARPARAEATYNDADAVLHEAVKIEEHLAAQDTVLEDLIDKVQALRS